MADTFTAPAAPSRERSDAARPRRAAVRVPRSALGVLAALLVLIAVSVWLRTATIHFFYWIDEGISVGIASHPLTHIPALMHEDGSPPLYYLILHVWMSAVGHDEVATHTLSLVFSLLCIPVAYWAAASLFDRRSGLVCAALAAGVPYLTTYAQETRMYSLVALLSVVVAASFVHAFVLRRRRYLPVFTLSVAAAAYTHNWALFLGVMCGVAFLWCVRSRPTERVRLWRDGALAFGGVVVLVVPWLPTLAFQARHTGAPWDLAPVVWSLTQGLYVLVGGRGAAMTLLLAGGTGLVSLRAVAPRNRLSGAGSGMASRERPALQLAAECLLIVGLGTLALAWAYSKLSPAWAPRYLAVVVGPLLLVFGLGLARAGRLGMVALALTLCFWVLDPVAHNRNTKSNVASVAAQVRPRLGADPLVLSSQPEEVPVIAYYLPGVRRFGTPLGPVADPRVVDWRDALARLRRSSVRGVLGPMVSMLRPGQRVMLVTPVNFPKSPLWMRLINRATARWSYFLAHDRTFRRVASSDAKWFDAGIAVQAVVYERR